MLDNILKEELVYETQHGEFWISILVNNYEKDSVEVSYYLDKAEILLREGSFVIFPGGIENVNKCISKVESHLVDTFEFYGDIL